MKRKLVLHVVGARPNYMKVAPLYAALAESGHVEQRLVHTGQHYDAIVKDVFFGELPLPRPHIQLTVGSGAHGEQTARALTDIEQVLLDLRPDLLIVPGDVNSTLAAALAAVKLHTPVCHLEAGLRSFDWEMPEEHNRRLTDHISTLLLTHSAVANDNLAREGISENRIAFVGNTMIDSLLNTVDRARSMGAWRRYGLRCREYLLVTLHRPALVDDPGLLLETMAALERVARSLPVIFPVHPRTLERLTNLGFVASKRLTVTTPLAYRRFVSLEVGAAAVLTDSGGVQEETTALGIPCFTLRENTERPVTVTHGTNTVLGLEPARIDEVPALLDEIVPAGPPPLWDGHAGERAASAVESYLEVGAERVTTTALTHPLAVRARPTLQ